MAFQTFAYEANPNLHPMLCPLLFPIFFVGAFSGHYFCRPFFFYSENLDGKRCTVEKRERATKAFVCKIIKQISRKIGAFCVLPKLFLACTNTISLKNYWPITVVEKKLTAKMRLFVVIFKHCGA